jgi:hypothetical protein
MSVELCFDKAPNVASRLWPSAMRLGEGHLTRAIARTRNHSRVQLLRRFE